MPDPTTLAWIIGAVVVAVAAGWLTSRAGYYYVTLYTLNSAHECSSAYLNPVSRWLLYYGLPLVLVLLAAWMLPHWTLFPFVILFVLPMFWWGSLSKINEKADAMIRDCTMTPAKGASICTSTPTASVFTTTTDQPAFRYYLGEPLFAGARLTEKAWFAPVGRVEPFLEVLGETQDFNEVRNKLRLEYIAIATTLHRMGINVRIVCTHLRQLDPIVQRVCHKLGLHTELRFPAGVHVEKLVFPRDYYAVLPGGTLLNSCFVPAADRNKAGDPHIAYSPYGEGGRVLSAGNIIIVSEATFEGGLPSIEDSTPPRKANLKDVEDIGVDCNIAGLFNHVVQRITPHGPQERYNVMDHIDCIAALLSGKDGGIHLVVDPTIHLAFWDEKRGWRVWQPDSSIKHLNKLCRTLSITLHCPQGMVVPYALNLEQFPDGRVLMSSGDDCISRVVSDIVGPENVFYTPIPIRFFPTWLKGGIRCLINRIPPHVEF